MIIRIDNLITNRMNDNTENKMRNKMKKVIVSLVILFQVSITNSQTSQNDMPVLKGPYLGQTLPGTKPVIFAPGIVSTGLYTRDIAITKDGTEFCKLFTLFSSYVVATLI